MGLRRGQEADIVPDAPALPPLLPVQIVGKPGVIAEDPTWLDTGAGWFDFIYGAIKSGSGVPVGPPIDRRDIRFPQSGRIPTLVPKLPKPRPILKQVVGRGLPQITEVLPVQAPVVLPQVRTGPSTEVGGPSPTTIEQRNAKMPDLGSVFGGHFGLPGWEGLADLGANLLGYGGPSPPVANVPVSGSGGTLGGTVPTVQSGGGMGLPPMGGGGGACGEDPRNQYVLKFSCGEWKWIKKRKRRSKRLATSSDIKDLSSLKGVLGDGKNLSTWIATHR